MLPEVDFFKAVIDSIEEGVLLQNRAAEIVGFNEKALQLLHLSKPQLLNPGSHPEGWELVDASGAVIPEDQYPCQLTLQTGAPQQDVLTGVKVKGKISPWLKISTKLLTLNQGAFVMVTLLDVTEHYWLEDELRQSEERWHLAVDGSGLGVWDWRVERQETYFSNTWKKMIGYSETELSNDIREWEDRIHPDDKPRVMGIIKRLTRGEYSTSQIEHRLRCKDGSYKWILTSGKVMTRSASGKPLRLVGTLKDIHDRKMAEQQLRLSESKFSKTFYFSSIGLALVSPEGAWMEVNPALCQMLGYTQDELQAITFQDITHPDDLGADLDNVQRMLSREITSYQMEKRYFHKDGHLIWVLLSVSLVWDTAGQPSFFISQIIDISHSKNLIAQLEDNNQKLRITTHDLENKIHQLEEFNRIVSHNLRGPAGNVRLMLDLLPTDLPQAIEVPAFQMLLKSSDALNETLADLMNIVEARMNKNIAYDTCSFKEVLEKTYSALEGQILNSHARIEEDLALETVAYPKIYLESILYNLLSNALKYSQKGVYPHIKIKTYTAKGRTVLSVRDNGLGIDLKRYGNDIFKLKKIFHKGFDSRGVGLFLVKNQIETLGGTIQVKSKPLVGSKFIVTF
ncbi:PAS domain-containing protein [Rufibacter quisquiliarum]|uniref:histidine kinase n=1 Tax=Rufibacter quisquiliarum TaxID=1549639 RepID=A0A839GEC7_9BACT|nr:PAS domain S-box protein [Rufibacter quisquiliarum]MBA9075883.1 PAS domain S-box-containing protein [Rufibacter quisquiliarum]